MQKRFEQQMTLGTIPIRETKITTKKRSGALPGLCAALKEIFITPEWNERVFEILERKTMAGKTRTGRPGMDLWQIFVLSQVRLCMNISYDDLHDLANNHALIRQIMGVEKGFGYERYARKPKIMHIFSLPGTEKWENQVRKLVFRSQNDLKIQVNGLLFDEI